MSIHLHWYLPTSGDGREVIGAQAHLGTASAPRAASLDYLALVARAVEQLGFEAVLTPTGTHCNDAWLTTAALLRETRTLKFLVAFRPGLVSPTLAAQQAAAYQEISDGRLLLNIVTGGDAQEQRRFGDWLDHDRRYERTAEFLTVLRGAWSGTPFDHTGEHYQVQGATVHNPPSPVPEVFFGGASPAGREVAAQHADTYLTWTEPPARTAELLDDVRARAARHGRSLSHGIRVHVISRDTTEEAWAEAARLQSRIDPALASLVQDKLATVESEGQRRQTAQLAGANERLEVYPGLWAGYGLIRPGAGTALVGSHQEVADLLAEYAALGVDHFILSGQPHLEEAYWFGEGVVPLLRRRGLLGDGGPDQAPPASPASPQPASGASVREPVLSPS
ncbi:LLM class flavin-dependent oxidoreductase [Rhodococcus sp. X156]|uniref:LLM class flavin-dependent oxidoreductase n=1 Tax=Rhodococcus sp. X156 TaxID=2499145 RepID=UPI000FD93A12|nr:LLM class flavin-dependent oxidoreductase [Rhodococcus sp. X156]